MTVLESGTLPAIAGNAQLTGAVAVGPDAELDVASGVSQTGVFEYSNARPVLSSVATSTPEVSIATVASVSQTGVFVYAAARPALTGISSITLGQSGAGPAIATPPVTRQILIR
jgi:hypothetical protein